MPWVDEFSGPQEYQRCIRDLAAVSTLPAIWTDYNPQQIADSLAPALLSMVNADFVYVALPEMRLAVEAFRTNQTTSLGSSDLIRQMLHRAWPGRGDQVFVIDNPLGEEKLRVTAAPIGFGGHVVVGSANPWFPSEIHRLVLGIAANAATTALQHWQGEAERRSGRPMNVATVSRDLRGQKKLETDLRHLNESLEQRVALRTSELADAVQQLTVQTSERKRADAHAHQLQVELYYSSRLSAAGQMAGALAHELNQPLTAIANSANAASRIIAKGATQRVDTVREILNETVDQALRAGEIIRRLREFVTRGETEKRIENLPTLISEASHLVSAGTGAQGVQLRLKFDSRADTVLCNRVQLQQVMVNLMRNSYEAMAQSDQRELDVVTVRRGQETVEITITDRGRGLPDEIVEHIFEPFHTTKPNGMGLGLSICRSIVEAHRGKLEYQPNREGGAIFRITLPATFESVSG